MRQNVKAYLNDKLPTGISYRTKDGNLWVSKYREIKHNGEKVSKRLAETVKLGITPDMSDAKAKEQIDNAISNAVKVRNLKRRKLVERYAAKREELKAKGDWEGLDKLPRNSSSVRLHNRCNLSGRPKGYMRKFGISRLEFRKMASEGKIPGITKASW